MGGTLAFTSGFGPSDHWLGFHAMYPLHKKNKKLHFWLAKLEINVCNIANFTIEPLEQKILDGK